MLVIVQSLRVPALRPGAIAALVRTFQPDKIDKVQSGTTRRSEGRHAHCRPASRSPLMHCLLYALCDCRWMHMPVCMQWGTVAAASTLTVWRISSAVFKALAQLILLPHQQDVRTDVAMRACTMPYQLGEAGRKRLLRESQLSQAAADPSMVLPAWRPCHSLRSQSFPSASSCTLCWPCVSTFCAGCASSPFPTKR